MANARRRRRVRGTSPKSETARLAWAGKNAEVNTLTGNGAFDPLVPIGQPGEEGDDALIWADVPRTLEERLAKKPQ